MNSLPNGWNICPLGDLAAFKGGGTPSTRVAKFWGGEIEWLTPKEITNIKTPFPLKSERTISNLGLSRSSADLLPVNTILVTSRASIGNVALVDRPLSTNQGFINILPSDKVDFLFLYHYVIYCKKEWIERASGSTFLEISKEKARDIPIIMPESIEEQKAIARILSETDQLIYKFEELITKKENIKQGMMQELLTGKTRLPNFNDEWQETNLGEQVRFSKGYGISKKDIVSKGSLKCIHYGQLFTKYSEVINNIDSYTNRKDLKSFSVANDVLMPSSCETAIDLATASSVSESGIALGGDILIIRSNPKIINGDFLSRVLNNDKTQISKLAKGTTVFHIYASDMSKFKFKLPSLAEQKEIAKIILDSDKEINILKGSL